MMSTSLDARQSQMRTLLDQINSAAVTQLDSTLEAANSEVTPPGRLIAQATPSLVVSVGSGTVVNPNTSKNRVFPFLNNVPISSFVGGTITFPSTSGTITVSPGTNASITIGANQYVAVLVQLTSTGQLALTVGAAAGSLGAVVVPNSNPTTLPLGYIVVQSNGSSVIQSITNAMLYQFVGGGGSGGGSGSGGTGKNYLATYTASTSGGVANAGNGNFENGNTVGWSLAHSTLGGGTGFVPTSTATPGSAFSSTSGGSAASGNLSLSVVSSGSQIGGTYSGDLASSAASVAGDLLISNAFFIDAEDQAKPLTFSFYYKAASGTFNFSGTDANSFALWIYDVTNGLWIQPAGVYGMTQSSGVGYVTGNFQSSFNSTQYQLALININATPGAYSLYIDDFSISPQTAPLGAAVTDWIEYNLVIGATTTAPTPGTTSLNLARYRRVGDSLELEYHFIQTSTGSSGSGTYLFPLPSGLSIDTSKLPTAQDGTILIDKAVASNTANGQGPTTSIAYVVPYSSNQVALLRHQDTAGDIQTTLDNFIGSGEFGLGLTANVIFNFKCTIPILGWSSNVQMSSDTDTRIVAASYMITGGSQTPGAGQPIHFDTEILDTHGAVTTGAGTWKFTAPISGDYALSITQNGNAAGGVISLYKNGVSTGVVWSGSASGDVTGGTIVYPLNAGDYIFAADNNSSTYNQGTISITRLSGPSVIAASETVAASYYATPSTQSITANVQINYDTKVYDSHGSVTVGASWKFTAPISGLYEVSEHGQVATTPASFVVYKNGSQYSYTNTHLTSGIFSGKVEILLLAGDFIDIRPDTSTTLLGGNSPAIISQVFVRKVGNYL